jgi:small subunit ribosomal protein S17
MAEETSHKNEKIGEVVSTKMTKTIVVSVSRRVPHPLYKRIVTKRKRFYAHDEAGKLKRWTLGEVVRKAAVIEAPQPKDLDVKI